MVLWLLVLRDGHGSVSFHCGLLSTASDPYLDGSGHVFQRATWHLGNGTRTWGETHGVKIQRCYLSVQVTHLNPHFTATEAREDQ